MNRSVGQVPSIFKMATGANNWKVVKCIAYAHLYTVSSKVYLSTVHARCSLLKVIVEKLGNNRLQNTVNISEQT